MILSHGSSADEDFFCPLVSQPKPGHPSNHFICIGNMPWRCEQAIPLFITEVSGLVGIVACWATWSTRKGHLVHMQSQAALKGSLRKLAKTIEWGEQWMWRAFSAGVLNAQGVMKHLRPVLGTGRGRATSPGWWLGGFTDFCLQWEQMEGWSAYGPKRSLCFYYVKRNCRFKATICLNEQGNRGLVQERKNENKCGRPFT